MKSFRFFDSAKHWKRPARVRHADTLIGVATAEELRANQERTAKMPQLNRGKVWEGNPAPLEDTDKSPEAVIAGLSRYAYSAGLRDAVRRVQDAISALPAAQRGGARSYAVIAITDASAPPGHPSRELGHPADDGDDDAQQGTTPAAMQDANRDFWDRVGNRYRAGARDRAAEIARPGTPRAVQLGNESFWANQPKVTTKGWGQR